METIFILFVLIVALIGLVGVRKENEALEVVRTQFKGELEKSKECLSDNGKLIGDQIKELCDQDDGIKALKLSNRSLKGANTKHKATIENLEKRIDSIILTYEEIVNTGKKANEEQADTIKKLLAYGVECQKKHDESKVVCEALVKLAKKKDMEEAKAIVKSYYQM